MLHDLSRRALPLGFTYRFKLWLLRLMMKLHLRKAQILEGNPVSVMGLTFPNRCGVACGIDKHGDYIDALAVTGAAYLAIGPITPKATIGKIKPRLQRGRHKQLILRKYQPASKGMQYLRKQLNKSYFRGILALTLSKQPETPAIDVIHDFQLGMQEVYPYANFLVFDFTWMDWQLMPEDTLRLWLADLLLQLKVEQGVQITSYHRYVPLMVKIRPDLPDPLLNLVARLVKDIQLEGVVLADHVVVGPQDLAGAPTIEATRRAISLLRQQLPQTAAIIAEGGNIDIAHASSNLAAGADLVGIYSGWFLEGEALQRQLAKL